MQNSNTSRGDVIIKIKIIRNAAKTISLPKNLGHLITVINFNSSVFTIIPSYYFNIDNKLIADILILILYLYLFQCVLNFTIFVISSSLCVFKFDTIRKFQLLKTYFLHYFTLYLEKAIVVKVVVSTILYEIIPKYRYQNHVPIEYLVNLKT